MRQPPDKRSGPATTPDRPHKASDLAAEASHTVAQGQPAGELAAKQTPRRDTGGQQTSAGSITSSPSVHGTPDGQPCLWLMAAARTGSHAVVATVIRLHPPSRCPPRRERAA
jgi:hypothetical protein